MAERNKRMKNYEMYMDRQTVSASLHEKLLTLEPPARPSRVWRRWGALAACCALIAGLGLWRLGSRQTPGREDPGTPAIAGQEQPADDVTEITYRR